MNTFNCLHTDLLYSTNLWKNQFKYRLYWLFVKKIGHESFYGKYS